MIGNAVLAVHQWIIDVETITVVRLRDAVAHIDITEVWALRILVHIVEEASAVDAVVTQLIEYIDACDGFAHEGNRPIQG